MGNIDSCRNGHEYTESNTVYRNGIRACRECAQSRPRKSQARRKVRKTTMKGAEAARIIVDELEPVSAVASRTGHDRKTLKAMAWSLVADQVRERDNRQCTWCGVRGERLHVHHRKPKGIGGADAVTEFGMGNLITLCSDHHREVHANPERSQRAGWIVPSAADPEVTVIDTGARRIQLTHDGRRLDSWDAVPVERGEGR